MGSRLFHCIIRWLARALGGICCFSLCMVTGLYAEFDVSYAPSVSESSPPDTLLPFPSMSPYESEMPTPLMTPSIPPENIHPECIPASENCTHDDACCSSDNHPMECNAGVCAPACGMAYMPCAVMNCCPTDGSGNTLGCRDAEFPDIGDSIENEDLGELCLPECTYAGETCVESSDCCNSYYNVEMTCRNIIINGVGHSLCAPVCGFPGDPCGDGEQCCNHIDFLTGSVPMRCDIQGVDDEGRNVGTCVVECAADMIWDLAIRECRCIRGAHWDEEAEACECPLNSITRGEDTNQYCECAGEYPVLNEETFACEAPEASPSETPSPSEKAPAPPAENSPMPTQTEEPTESGDMSIDMPPTPSETIPHSMSSSMEQTTQSEIPDFSTDTPVEIPTDSYFY